LEICQTSGIGVPDFYANCDEEELKDTLRVEEFSEGSNSSELKNYSLQRVLSPVPLAASDQAWLWKIDEPQSELRKWIDHTKNQVIFRK